VNERAARTPGFARVGNLNLSRIVVSDKPAGPAFSVQAGAQILDIMHPGREVGIGIDLIWQYGESDIPGAAVCIALRDGKTSTGIT
jgi:hypothetical protein